MFSRGSLALLSSSFVAVVDGAVTLSPSADIFLSVCGAAFAPDAFLVRSPVLLWAMSRFCALNIKAKTTINLTSVFIGCTPESSRKVDRESYRKHRAVVQALEW